MASFERTATTSLAGALAAAPRLVVRQRRELVEVFTSLESANRYAIFTEDGGLAGVARERRGTIGAFLSRWLLQSSRPFTIDVDEADSQGSVLVLRRPWTWWLSRLEVSDADGRPLGIVRQRFTWLRRQLDLEAPGGRVLARLVGPVFRPWTFVVRAGLEGADREIGLVQKRWSGLLREGFTDADTFLVTLPPSDATLRRLVLAAAILVDFKWFEHRS
jgi:uncharacterized protein YxjI